MTTFRFRLEKVLEWRRGQLEAEEARFRECAAALAEVDRARAELQAAAVQAEFEVRRWAPVSGADLAALADFRRRVRANENELLRRRAECARLLAEQQNAMLEARRRCRALERLKERRLADWKSATEREIEALAAESHLATWASRQAPPL